MKKSVWKLLATLAVCLLCMVLPMRAGRALSAADLDALLGERAYGVESLTTSLPTGATVGQIVDWLEDYIDDEAGNALWMADDLQDMLYLIGQDAAAVAAYPGDQSGLASDAATIAGIADTAYINHAQMMYYYDRLSYAYDRMQYIQSLITGGTQSPEQQQELLVELTELYTEAQLLSAEATGSESMWRAAIAGAQGGLSAGGANSALVERIRAAARPILAAQADALARADAASGVPIVTVISDKEIGIGVTLPGNTRPDGIHVTVTGSGVTKSADTSKGAAVFWLADFKPDKKGRISVDVDVSFAGYRTMWLGTIQLKGGGTYFTQMVADNGKPYAIGATINGWDMMHVQNGMYLSSKNTATHDVVVRVNCKGQSCSVLGWQKTGSVSWRTVFSSGAFSGDDARYTFSAKLMQKGQKSAFQADKPFFISVYTGNQWSELARYQTQFTIENAAVEQPADQPEKPDFFKGLGIRLPSGWPVIGNAELKFPFDPPILVYVDLNGMIFFGTELDMGGDEGYGPQASMEWQKSTRNVMAATKTRLSEAHTATFAKAKQGIKSDNAKTEKKAFFSIDDNGASITPYLYGMLTYDKKSGYASGEMSAGISLGYKFSVSHEFALGPVPAFIGFDFEATLTVGVSLGVKANIKTWSNFSFSDRTGINVGLELKIGLTVGAGIPKIAYVALKGEAFVAMDLVLGPNSKGDPEFSAGLAALVEVKILFFSKSWTLWSHKWPSNSLDPGMQNFFVGYALSNIPSADDVPFVEDYLAGLGFTASPATLDGETVTTYTNPGGTVTSDFTGSPLDARKPDSEWQVTQLLPTVSNDVKYMPTMDSSVMLGFFLGKCRYDNGLEGVRLYAAVLNRDKLISVIEMPMTRSVLDDIKTKARYAVDFDIDYKGNTYYFIFACRATHYEQVPADLNEAAMLKRMAESRDEYKTYTGSWVYDVTRRTFGSTSSQLVGSALSGSLRVCALRERNDAVFGGIQVEPGDEHARGYYQFNTGIVSQAGTTYSGLFYNANKHTMPDALLLPYLGELRGKRVPICIGLSLSKDFPNTSTLRVGWGDYTLTDFGDLAVKSLAPIRQNLPGNTYDTLGVISLQSQMKKGKIVNTLFALFTKGMHDGISADDAIKVLKGKNLGVQVGADGVDTVSVDMSAGSPQIYAYWLESHLSEPDANKRRTEVNELKACLIDMKTQLATPSFTWLEVGKRAARMRILPIRDQRDITGIYLNFPDASATGYGVRGIKFSLESKAELLAIATQYPIITQGRNFNFDLRVQNTGSLVALGFDVEILAKAMDPAEPVQEVTIKNVHVDTVNRQDSSEFYPGGAPVTGAYTVYPMPDMMEAYRGNWAQTASYTFNSSGQAVQTRSGVEYSKGLLPNAFASYRTEVKAPQSKWHGKYTLAARITGYRCATSMDGTGPMYDVTLNDDGTVASSALVPGSLVLPTATTPEEQATVDRIIDNYEDSTSEYYRGAPMASGNTLAPDTEYNDLRLEAEVVMMDNVPYASVNLSNPANSTAPGVTYRLVASVDGHVTNTIGGFTSLLDSGYGRSMLIPLSTLANGTPYDQIDLTVEPVLKQRASLTPNAINPVSSTDTLYATPSVFFVESPQDITVQPGDKAAFRAEADSLTGGPITYQWYVRTPDGGYSAIAGATSPELPYAQKAQLAQDGLVFWCMAYDQSGAGVMSGTALLRVRNLPKTGDECPLGWMIALLALSLAGLAAAGLARRRHG